ncbi:Essential protein Yae1, N terminal [Vermiconidia calcicola]|uniref:Essential protein Yae1, N terminal n=1 Tax=Vermiconidia calcicola TaxID=1690605 RepID=A0ACC3MJA7_9PEZI|nr:Essential protein Yae1, N terminal [Vermiconidia calcicola]
MLRDVPTTTFGTDEREQDNNNEIFMTSAPGTSEDENNSNAPSYTDPLDDVFGSAPSSPTTDHQQQHSQDTPRRNDETHPSDIPRLRTQHTTAGYRDGLSTSKESHVQAGFDEGYALGAELGLRGGWVLGVLEGLSLSRFPAAGEHLLRQAEEELDVRKLFGQEWFGEDGVWRYDVAGQGEEEEVTFKEVAEAHPVLRKWMGIVRELASGLALRLEEAGA